MMGAFQLARSLKAIYHHGRKFLYFFFFLIIIFIKGVNRKVIPDPITQPNLCCGIIVNLLVDEWFYAINIG